MLIQILDVDELQLLLGKAYWIESNLELAVQWDAYMTMSEKHRDILFTIAHDSEKHRMLLKDLCNNIKGLNLEKETAGLEKKAFDFTKMIDEEIFTQMLQYELLVMDIYTKLYTLTDKNFLQKIWKEGNIDEYYNKFKWLIKEEERHRDLLQARAGNVSSV